MATKGHADDLFRDLCKPVVQRVARDFKIFFLPCLFLSKKIIQDDSDFPGNYTPTHTFTQEMVKKTSETRCSPPADLENNRLIVVERRKAQATYSDIAHSQLRRLNEDISWVLVLILSQIFT